MARRTRAQHKTDDLAFPIRMKFTVPRDGLGARLDRAYIWLRENVGAGRWAIHSAQAISSQAVGVYFVSISDAERFVAAFPEMQIADGTRCGSYTAPGTRQAI